MKRILSAVALSGLVALMGAGGAQATTYPAPAPAVAVSDGTVTPGETITFSGTGFTPGETVEITVSNEGQGTGSGSGAGRPGASVGTIVLPMEVKTSTVVADASGKFSTQVTLNETGTYTLTAKGLTSGKTQTTVVTVVASQAAAGSSATPDNLANTGVENLVLWGAAGLGGVAFGTASLLKVRRNARA